MQLVREHARFIWGGVLGVVALILLGVATYFMWFQPQPANPSARQSTPTVVAPKPVGLSSHALFFGNVFWGRYINDWSMASPLRTAYPFSRLNEFKRQNYDAWIAGLECPTVAGFHQTSAEEDATLSFNCSPDYLPEAAKWFTAFTLANNHTDNRGADGFTETKRHLDENGIQYFGHYDPYLKNEACEVVAFPVTVAYDNKATKKEKLPIASCGFHGVFKIPPAETINQIKKYAAVMPVIAMPHMGAEYQPAPDGLKTDTYRAMIDAGADMVLGDHPHWVQTTEVYKGRLIVYSMGNFIFDQQGSTELTRSAAIDVVMKTTNVSSDTLASWVALGNSCSAFKDTCLQQAVEKGLSKIPLTYTYDVVGTSNAGKLVKPATKAEEASLLQRLGWSSTMNQLQSPQ